MYSHMSPLMYLKSPGIRWLGGLAGEDGTLGWARLSAGWAPSMKPQGPLSHYTHTHSMSNAQDLILPKEQHISKARTHTVWTAREREKTSVIGKEEQRGELEQFMQSVLVLVGYSWRTLLIHLSFITAFLPNSQILSFSLSFQSFISSLHSQKPLPFPSGWFLRTKHIIIVFNQCPSWLFSMSSPVLPRAFGARALSAHRPTFCRHAAL